MARTAPMTSPAQPSAWTLRDEMAMRILPALVTKATWGHRQADGSHRSYSTMAEYSEAAYQFADEMLKARERC